MKGLKLSSSELMCPFLTCEYPKRNERVIEMDGIFTHSLTGSLTHSIHHADVNFLTNVLHNKNNVNPAITTNLL